MVRNVYCLFAADTFQTRDLYELEDKSVESSLY